MLLTAHWQGEDSLNNLDSMIYLKNLFEAADHEFDYRRPLSSGGWENWQIEFRARLSELIVHTRINKKFDGLQLCPRSVEIKHFTDYTREKICITTEPGIEISFYLLLPKFHEGPLPLVVTTHGHERVLL